MNETAFDKLKGEKLDFSTYGKLPLRDDVLAIEEPEFDDRKAKVLLKKWELLNYLRKNLKILDGYLGNNKDESLIDWLKKNGAGMSDVVIKKIGRFNNKTGGISAYFLNLQKMYDEKEADYDVWEMKSKVCDEDKDAVSKMRDERGEKRKNRQQIRKILFKDLKADNKGYLEIEIEEEPVLVMAADGKVEDKKEPEVEEVKQEVKEEVEKVKKSTGKIIVVIAGISLVIATVAAVTSSKK